MKASLPLIKLLRANAYPLALAGSLVGLAVNVPVFFGCFTAVNVLAIALCSYSAKPGSDVPRTPRRPAVATTRSVEAPPPPWTCNTVSA